MKVKGYMYPQMRKPVGILGIHCRWKKGRIQGRPHAMSLTKINFMHTIVYDFFSIKQTICLIQNNLMHATQNISL
jgi:hypothetical protein